MKKFILITCTAFFFLACSSKEDESRIAALESEKAILSEENSKLKKQLSELEEKASVLEGKVSELEKTNAGLLEEIENLSSSNINLDDKEKFENHKLSYSLTFEYGGFDTKVYKSPKKGKEIYTIQKADKVNISNLIYVKDSRQCYIKVSVNNIEGFIEIRGNPYKNGNFEVIDSITVDNDKISLLKMEGKFVIGEGTVIKDAPSKDAKALHTITHAEGRENYSSNAITSDYEWVKVSVGEIRGWVPADSLSVDRGGPTLNTPEEYIYFDLIGSNLI